MTGDALRKAGWTWTKKGWKRRPQPAKRVKAVPMPTKPKMRKTRRVSAAAASVKKPTFAEARKLAVGQGGADSAPTPAPEIAKRTTPPIRKAWGGKYDDLAKPSEGKA